MNYNIKDIVSQYICLQVEHKARYGSRDDMAEIPSAYLLVIRYGDNLIWQGRASAAIALMGPGTVRGLVPLHRSWGRENCRVERIENTRQERHGIAIDAPLAIGSMEVYQTVQCLDMLKRIRVREEGRG